MKYFSAFPDVLHSLRRSKRLTQAEVAEEIGVNRKTVGNWESGRGYPDLKSVDRLLVLFDITPKDLVVLMEGRSVDGKASGMGDLLDAVTAEVLRQVQERAHQKLAEEGDVER